MQAFSQLYAALEATSRTSEKVRLLSGYFRTAPASDAVWALWFLSGRKVSVGVGTGELRDWVGEVAGVPRWLVDECYEVVGDLAETLALLIPYPAPEAGAAVPALSVLVEERLLRMAGAGGRERRAWMEESWRQLDGRQRFLWHKLVTGGFRVGVSQALLVRALAEVAGVEAAVMAHRLMGGWQPTADAYRALLDGAGAGDDPARPYPFCLAAPLEGDVEALGPVEEWQVEWKWDGIRVQVIRRAGGVVVWSRGEEMVGGTFPEVVEGAAGLPDGTVLDGELVAWGEGRVQPFARLQRRLNRKAVRAADRAAVPVRMIVYDLLESGGVDWRMRPLRERRVELERVVDGAIRWAAERGVDPGREAGEAGAWVQGDLFGGAGGAAAGTEGRGDGDGVNGGLEPGAVFRVPPVLAVAGWSEVSALRAGARAGGTEGVMLKRGDGGYGVGRQRGVWWKWKVDPFTCDAVLVAAQPGHGRRATLYTDYTFAVWDGDKLVPVAKAYSGLTDAEIDAVDAFVRANITGRFGPVRSVTPELVFELAFDGVAVSGRHKAGVALRFPRMARWRRDKVAGEADTLETLRRLAGGEGGEGGGVGEGAGGAG